MRRGHYGVGLGFTVCIVGVGNTRWVVGHEGLVFSFDSVSIALTSPLTASGMLFVVPIVTSIFPSNIEYTRTFLVPLIGDIWSLIVGT